MLSQFIELVLYTMMPSIAILTVLILIMTDKGITKSFVSAVISYGIVFTLSACNII